MKELYEYFRSYPPLHLMVRSYLGIKENNEVIDQSKMIEDGIQVRSWDEAPEWVKKIEWIN